MKLKYDVSGSDPEKARGGSFEQPQPGVYTARVNDITQKESKSGNPMLEVVAEVTDKKYKGARLWDYIVLNDASAWKLDQFLQALGVATDRKRKGTVDTEELIGTSVKVRVKGETYNDEYRARLAAWMPMPDDEDDEDLSEDDDDLDLDEDEDDSDDAEDEGDDDSDEDEGGSDDLDDDYENMGVAELREELKERDLNPRGAKPALIARLRENDSEPY